MAMAIHRRTCNLCEAMCGILIEHDGARIASVRGDPDDPLSGGHICPKALALGDIHADPDRLRHPQRRVGDRWEACGWEQALEDVADRIVDIQKRHGRNAVAIYVGNPTIHNHGTLLYGMGLLETLGTFNRFSATSVDQLPHMLAALTMFGHQILMPVPDVDRCDFLLMLGANPLVSNGSIMVAPGMDKRLKALKKRGKLVVVDPRRTETAALADQHLALRPGTDGLLLAALIHTLYDEDRVALGRLAAFTDGVDELGKLVQPLSPESVAQRTGIDASVIRELGRELSSARRSACYGRVGICLQPYGGVNAWLLNALNVVTGSLDREGGMMFTRPAVDLVRMSATAGQKGHFAKGTSRVRGLPEFGGEYPVVALAEEIETPGEGQIRALITVAGNPVLSTPNGRRLERALGNLELMVSLDLYRNETSRHAHYILPPTSQLEQSHYDLALSAFAVRNTAKYSPALFTPPADAKADWQILLELTTRLAKRRGGLARLAGPVAKRVLAKLGPDGIVDQLLRWGSYGRRKAGGLSLKKLRDNPSGIDLGALEPCLPARLYTRDKRIKLVPETFAVEVTRLVVESETQAPEGELLLIGRRLLHTNNSWNHNSERMVKGRDRCTLLMHPDDAAALGLEEGQRVTIASRVGEVAAPLVVSDEVRRGVVSLPHGFGHHRPGMQLSVASRQPGVSANDLTDETMHCGLTGTAALNGVPVSVRASD